MAEIIFDAQIRVNNEAVNIIPNSAKFVPGFGESSIMTQSSGNGNVEQVRSENIETKISKLIFSMRSTTANIAQIESWKRNKNANGITVTADGGFVKVIDGAECVIDPEYSFSNEGEIPIEFHGKQAR